jgi:hypothetical protein
MVSEALKEPSGGDLAYSSVEEGQEKDTGRGDEFVLLGRHGGYGKSLAIL